MRAISIRTKPGVRRLLLVCRWLGTVVVVVAAGGIEAWAGTKAFPVIAKPALALKEEDKAAAQEALAALHPRGDKASPPVAVTSPAGTYVLYGDLFGGGANYALIDLRGGVGIAAHGHRQWTLLDVAPDFAYWHRPGTPVEPGPYKSYVERPFQLKKLEGVGATFIIVPDEPYKGRQPYHVLHFNAHTGHLDNLADSGATPAAVGDWLILNGNSGRRAVWEEDTYYRWEGDHLRPKATWRWEFDEHNQVPPGHEPDFEESGEFQIWHTTPHPGDTPRVVKLDIARQDKIYANLRIQWKASLARSADDMKREGAIEAWLFEKTTGLPRRLRQTHEESKLPRLESMATVSVTGRPAAVKRFSVGRKAR